MIVASFGAGGASFNQVGNANPSMNNTNAIENTQPAGDRKQVSQVIGDPQGSNGQAITATSTQILSDGTIKDLVLTYLLDKSDDKDKKNSSSFLFAKELYDAANQLQTIGQNQAIDTNMNSGGMSQGGGMGGGQGGGMGGGGMGGGMGGGVSAR
jgi:hypothetical protein